MRFKYNLRYGFFFQKYTIFLFCESSVNSIAIDITSREFSRKAPPIPRNRARVQRRIQLPRSVQEWIIARSGLSSFISSLRGSPILFSPPIGRGCRQQRFFLIPLRDTSLYFSLRFLFQFPSEIYRIIFVSLLPFICLNNSYLYYLLCTFNLE